MLELLHRIVKEVNSAEDLGSALQIIVGQVKQAIDADVCSVYLTDFERREHVLMYHLYGDPLLHLRYTDPGATSAAETNAASR